jgi:transposase
MYLDYANVKSSSGKIHRRVLLRKSYREKGKVRKKTLSNLSALPQHLLDLIDYHIGAKGKAPGRLSVDAGCLRVPVGKKFGALYVLHHLAKGLGIIQALGNGVQAQRISWLVYARLLFQGSRLKAARKSRRYAVKSLLGLDNITSDDLYASLDWLAENQERIEDKLMRHNKNKRQGLFLYDVTSCYFEGEHNELADYGYNRDGKRGKKQIVIGLLTDADGEPLSIEVFPGNTTDPTTCSARIKDIKRRFGADSLTLVGDRGMIKEPQIEKILEHGWSYITAITKPQIEKLLREGVFQLGLFEEEVQEVIDGEVRYVVRKNPQRAEEINETRRDKLKKLQNKAAERSNYLTEHPRAKVAVAKKHVQTWAQKMKMEKWVEVLVENRVIKCRVNEAQLGAEAKLDGCYCIKTNIADSTRLTTQQAHDRYTDLAQVELAFRTMKTTLLENRPIYHRLESRTRAVCFISMLAYKIARSLTKTLSPHTEDLLKLMFPENKREADQQAFPLEDILSELDMIQETTWRADTLTLPIILTPSPVSQRILSLLKIKLPTPKPT